MILAIKDDIYGLALRMLWHPADAEDATQEVLIRVCTSLASFEGRAAFRTWVYRVAVRALLNVRRGRVEPEHLSFEDFGADLRADFDHEQAAHMSSPERALLQREVRIGCTQAMLMCLDRDHRLAYLLGEVFGLSGSEAAAVLELTPPTYRKRLSRARARVEAFTASTCGLVSERAPCRCAGRIAPAIQQGRVDPKRLLFARHPVTELDAPALAGAVEALEALCDTATLMRQNPRYRAPERIYTELLARLG